MRFRSAIRDLAFLGVALFGFAAAGCANPSYDTESTRAELEAAGLTSEQATCVTRSMERRFGDRRLNAHEEATAEERADFDEILAECGVDVTPGEADSS